MQEPVGACAPRMGSEPTVSILIPTLNEAANVAEVLARVSSALGTAGLDAEILVVDGGSTDGTAELASAWRGPVPARVVRSETRGGLASELVAAAREARAPVVVVLDADLSHPPERIPELARPILAGTHDMALGSRYTPGGSTPDWPLQRRLVSRAATGLARPFASARDPLAGFFAVRRDLLVRFGGEAEGFKIALEILARADDALRVVEVPVAFRDRSRGRSKLGGREIGAYLRQLVRLAGGSASVGHGLRFAATGLAGMVVDLAVFAGLVRAGAGVAPAQVASFFAATVANYALNARWAFASAAAHRTAGTGALYVRYLAVCLLALFLRSAVLSALIEGAGWPPLGAVLAGIGAAAAVNFTGTAFFVFPNAGAAGMPRVRWRVLAGAAVAYAAVLRLAFAGIVDLIPEEAYYWNYAQHPALGYLDHPPMVAWLIWLGTRLFGNHEFAVRLPSFVAWTVTAGFVFALARNLYGKSAAWTALLALAVLPIYFGTGLFMTPDAPLHAAWAGALFFLERAILADRRRAWWGVGAAVGLGMLSKYTIALVGLGAFVFVLVDRPSRRVLRTPGPYLAVLTAAALFAPVLWWNAQHDWASFVFQGPRRWSGDVRFSLHVLVGSVLVLLTPLGAVGVARALAGRGAERVGEAADAPSNERRRRFALVLTLVPLAVFALHSLRDKPKLNWTGPLWLAALPLLAARIAPARAAFERAWARAERRRWAAAATALLVAYGATLYFVYLGLPGLPARRTLALPIAWSELGDRVEAIEHEIEAATGADPMIAGLSKYHISAELAFYDPHGDGAAETTGRHLLGGNSLMWAWWLPPAKALGRNVILVDFGPEDLDEAALGPHFASLGALRREPIEKGGRVVGWFHWRVGYGYLG